MRDWRIEITDKGARICRFKTETDTEEMLTPASRRQQVAA